VKVSKEDKRSSLLLKTARQVLKDRALGEFRKVSAFEIF
jgi:hypothetical protein